ncbi:MAG: TonB-dependent receptor [Sphingobium sp.]|nr:TonB-dependent receptor [Sphingobium sp.]
MAVTVSPASVLSHRNVSGRFSLRIGLLAGAAISLANGLPAFAQATNMADDGDIIVTATRQAVSINSVPMSISAVTQADMDQKNIRSAADLARGIPGLRASNSGSSNGTQDFSIRGVASEGSPTTGVYLDDAPLQKRSGPRGSGAPMPQLFDLERVEVLKGPQGTLYGGGSQGGTVRFITPTPSLTDYQVYARGELSKIEKGDWNQETGVAFGGPIIEDKIGFRASVYQRRNGGYLDYVNRHDGSLVERDANSSRNYSARAALRFKLSDRFELTPSLYWSLQKVRDQDAYWLDVPERTGRDGYVYGPYNFYGPYRSGDTCNIGEDYAATTEMCVPHQPTRSELFMPSVTAQYEFDTVQVKGIFSYASDSSRGRIDFSYQEPQNHQQGNPFIHNLDIYKSYPEFKNKRDSYTGELRFSSINDDQPITFVGGLFYNRSKINADVYYYANVDDLTQALYGLPAEGIFGVPLLPNNLEYYRVYTLTDEEYAAYGEMTYKITDKLKIIGGLRVSQTKFDYFQETAGPIAGTNTPTYQNGGLIGGKVKETPISPKISLQYNFDPRNQIYAVASKGYRVGGINQPPPVTCAGDMTSLGITSTPLTYESDTVWNYEAGTKMRIAGMQINASAFYLEWTNTQTDYGLPTCGFGYTVNAGKAVSKGIDLDARVPFTDNLVGTVAMGYTDAKYTEAVVGPAPVNTVYIQDGDRLPIPKWSLNLGLQYGFEVEGHKAYIRGDYQYSGSYERAVRFGSAGYTPDNRIGEATHFVTARAGIDMGPVGVSIFADNLLNSKDVLSSTGGRTGCRAASGAACTSYSQYNQVYRQTTFRPRTLGLTLTYRH